MPQKVRSLLKKLLMVHYLLLLQRLFRKKKLSKKEADEIQKMINDYKEG